MSNSTTTSVEPAIIRRIVVDRTRDALSRAVRQALQALVPTLLVITASSSLTGIDGWSVIQLALVTGFVSVCKSVAGIKLPANAPVIQQLVERGLVAAAGTALGLATVDGTFVYASIAWRGLLTASLGSAVLAVIMFFTNPPVVQGDVVDQDRVPVIPPVES